MIIRSKAPLRIGLAGGGSDVSPYSDQYGGAILNATINLYAYASIEPRNDNTIVLHAIDKGERLVFESVEQLPINGALDILKGIYNRVVKDYGLPPLSFTLSTFVEAPPGSGLGSSSTLATAILGAFAEWQQLPLGEYDMAKLAFDVERKDLGLAGGKQDQYAATFGGVNFMEFYADDKVIVNPLRIKDTVMEELAFSLVLYYTGTSRESMRIIERQQHSVRHNETEQIEAMHNIKQQAIRMKEIMLKGQLDEIGPILDYGWQHKKKMAQGISSMQIDEIYKAAIQAGSTGGKVSGAGGGGFMFFYCPNNTRHSVIEALSAFGGSVHPFGFSPRGLMTWQKR